MDYLEESVGQIMNSEGLALKVGMSVQEALEFIRWRSNEKDILSQLFVVDKNCRLCGEITLVQLVTTDPPLCSIDSIMNKKVLALNVNEDQEIAVDYARKYDRNNFPVIDETGKLVGIVTADDLLNVSEEEATEDIQQFGGQSTLENTYFQTSYLTHLQKRSGWLALLFVGELFTGNALKHYEETIRHTIYFIPFLPLIMSSGGNSGSQTAALIIRGLALKEIKIQNWLKIFKRELFVGLGLGGIISFMGMIRSFTWGYDLGVALVVVFTLITVILFGVVMGAMLPLLFERLKIDPAVSSSPFIASLVDFMAVVMFIEISKFIGEFL